MLIHSDILLFELIKLSVEGTDNNLINITKLKNAYTNFIKILEKEFEKIQIDYDFNEALKHILDKYDDCIETNENNELEVTAESITDFYLKVYNNRTLSEAEEEIYLLVYEHSIIVCLNIKISDSIKEYFDACLKVLKAHVHLARALYDNNNPLNSINDLKAKLEESEELFESASEDELTKIKIALCELDFLNLPEFSYENLFFERFPWFIILFSNSFKEWESITYLEIQRYLDSYSINDFIDKYFLKFFLLYLTNIIKTIDNKEILETLITRQILLLATPELEDVEKDFLESHTLIIEPHTPRGLEDIDLKDYEAYVYKCIENLIIDDETLKKSPHLISEAIINCIFIKTYLKLCVDDKIRKYITDTLTTGSHTYKNPYYSIITQYIDDIIFSETLNLNR